MKNSKVTINYSVNGHVFHFISFFVCTVELRFESERTNLPYPNLICLNNNLLLNFLIITIDNR